MELLEKKMQRLEAARAAEIAQLTAELESARNSVVEQLSAKDAKVNDLIEELGNTQALLSEKEAALEEVRARPSCKALLELGTLFWFHRAKHCVACLHYVQYGSFCEAPLSSLCAAAIFF